LQHINPSTSPNELNTTLTSHSMIHGDACFAYFNKIWGIPGAGEKAPLKVKGNFRRFPHPLFTAILTTDVDAALLACTARCSAYCGIWRHVLGAERRLFTSEEDSRPQPQRVRLWLRVSGRPRPNLARRNHQARNCGPSRYSIVYHRERMRKPERPSADIRGAGWTGNDRSATSLQDGARVPDERPLWKQLI
jgi:hypothetical protein